MRAKDINMHQTLAELSQHRQQDEKSKVERMIARFRKEPDLSMTALAERFGFSETKVSDILTKHGLRRRGPRGGTRGSMTRGMM